MFRNGLIILLLLLIPVTSFAGDGGVRMYYGLARIGTTGGANIEVAGSWGSLYGVLGAHQGHGGFQHQELTFIMGYRHYLENDYDNSRFFTGLTFGDLDSTGSGPRYGIGPEFGYQLVKKYIRTTFSGVLGILEEIEEGDLGDDGEVRAARDIEPAIFLGLSINLRK